MQGASSLPMWTGRPCPCPSTTTKLAWPRAETPTHYIAMGIDEDLTVATQVAVQEAVNFLVQEKGLDQGAAYALASIAVDRGITELVDGNVGVHAMIPKSIFVER